MERCPCCNARLRERSTCSRCKTDLSTLIHSEQAAEDWLKKAIGYWEDDNIEHTIFALESSMALKQNTITQVFRDFIAHQQSQKILELLAQKQPLEAKQALFKIQALLPYSETLQQLHSFSDYLYLSTQKREPPI